MEDDRIRRALLSACPGCGLVADESGGPTHRYIGASPECWELFNEWLLRGIEQSGGDAYAAQHPGVPGPQARRSVAKHLLSLCRVLERGARPETAVAFLRSTRRDFPWLEPPAVRGVHTVGDVLRGDVETMDYARSVWDSWHVHHATVRAWLDEFEPSSHHREFRVP